MHPDGSIAIMDRSKDIIISGGEVRVNKIIIAHVTGAKPEINTERFIACYRTRLVFNIPLLINSDWLICRAFEPPTCIGSQRGSSQPCQVGRTTNGLRGSSPTACIDLERTPPRLREESKGACQIKATWFCLS